MDRRIGSGSGFGINGDSVSKGNEKKTMLGRDSKKI